MNYLNRATKERVLKFTAMVIELEDAIKDIEDHGGKCSELKQVKTRIDTYVRNVTSCLSDDKLLEFVGQARRREVGFYVK